MAALLFRKSRNDAPDAPARTGIIDIGSNSIRLVVYQGPPRQPAVLFNEKVLAGLGTSLAETGTIQPGPMSLARGALARFALLAREMQLNELRTVATAAVRDASNGDDLIATATAFGLDVEILSGLDEAMAAGMGVLSGIPDADGIVGDLGGGSLELVRIAGGAVLDRVSFPLGVLRLEAIRARGKSALDRHVARLFHDAGWAGRGGGLPFYLVGGSWRALARLDMYLAGYPLPVIHQYPMAREEIARLSRTISHVARGKLRAVPGMSGGRIPTLGNAAALLSSVLKHLGSERTIVSAFGLREGLLYQRLSAEQRAEDPLIAAARAEGARLGRFAGHGDLVERWIAPLFQDDAPELARLRHAACLLCDTGWRANPEFRAERGVDVGLHGNWVAIDAAGRAVLAQTLFTALGGGIESPSPLGRLADSAALDRAKQWGLAIRLGQRLSGGVAAPLERAKLTLEGDDALRLSLPDADAALYGEAVEKRLRALAAAMGRSAGCG
ncbi:MAG: Ppx/GppA family phosphatase [Pseudomonadota bacterium]